MIDNRKLDIIRLMAKGKAREMAQNYRAFMSAERSGYDGTDGRRGEENPIQPEDVGGEVQEPGQEVAEQVYGEAGGQLG